MSALSRRQFVQGVGLAGAGLLAGCGRLPGQGPAPPVQVSRVGYLALEDFGPAPYEAFRQGLRGLGYREG
jgi:hypothetical protein